MGGSRFGGFEVRLGDLIPGLATKRIGTKTFEYIWFYFWLGRMIITLNV